jgi:hypothetical protein
VTKTTRIVLSILSVFIFVLCANLTGCYTFTTSTTPTSTTIHTSTTTSPTETTITYLTTPGGIEYYAGLDADMKFVESRDGDIRVLAPTGISKENMELYLDRAYTSNNFTAAFFSSVPRLPQLVIISYDGQRWAVVNNAEHTTGWTPSVFPWNISYFTAKHHDGVVHVIANNWVNAYLPSREPANDFFAYYLGNAAAYVQGGGTLEDFTLKNAKTVLEHDSYFDGNDALTPAALSAMELNTNDSMAWAFGFQLKLEQNDKLGYTQIKQLAGLLISKYVSGNTFSAEDYLSAEQGLLAGTPETPAS